MFVCMIKIFFIISYSLVAVGQDLKLWRNLKPQFYGRSDGQRLSQGVIASSAYFFDDSLGWIVGTNGEWLGKSRGMMACTQDGGKTWRVEFSPVPSEFSDVFFVSSSSGWIVGSEQSQANRSTGVLLETTDSGKSWRKRTIGNFVANDFSSIYFSDQERGYIAGGVEVEGQHRAVIYRTSDGGKNWDLVYLGKRVGVLRDIKFEKLCQIGWAVGDDGEILYSKDGGKSWQQQKADFDGILLGLALVDQQEVWITASDFSLLHTNDGGMTWKVVSPQINTEALNDSAVWFSGVFFKDTYNGWVCGSNGIIINTENGGKTWQLEAIGTGDFLYKIFPTKKRILAIGKDAIVLERSL